jgi:hypothetical protein
MQKADLMQLILAKTKTNELIKLTADAESAELIYNADSGCKSEYLQLFSAAPLMFQQIELTIQFLQRLKAYLVFDANAEIIAILDQHISCLVAAQRMALGESNQNNKMLN